MLNLFPCLETTRSSQLRGVTGAVQWPGTAQAVGVDLRVIASATWAESGLLIRQKLRQGQGGYMFT